MTLPDCPGCRRRDYLIIERDATLKVREDENATLKRELAMIRTAWQASENARTQLARDLLHDLARRALAAREASS
jgi:hypothetical protein